MDSLPKLTEAAIRARATNASFERGYDYYRDGAVLEIARRGNQLLAEVEGSDYDPYQVSITLNEYGIVDAKCTCPYDWGGDCKHIVAVLLAYIRSPEDIEERPTIEAMLSDLDQDQLRELILELVDYQPDLAAVIQSQISLMQVADAETAMESEPSLPRKRQKPLDADSLRRQVQSAIRSMDYTKRYDDYWQADDVTDDLDKILEKARTFVEANDGNNALIILETITEELMGRLETLASSEYDESGFFLSNLGRLWIEAILEADLTKAEREEYAEQLDEWGLELDDNYLDNALAAASDAAVQGWDLPALKRVLSGESTDPDEWEQESPWHGDLAEARLNVLARQGRTQEYLNLAQAEGQTERYVTMLAQLERAQEAVDYGLQNLEHASEALALAEALHEKGEVESALRVAEHGLKLQDENGNLARWLRDAAADAKQPERALDAAINVIHKNPRLEDYLIVQTLANDRWPELREELLEYLRQASSWSSTARANIFLYEELIDDAIAALDLRAFVDYTLLEQVVDAAISTRPDWVIRTCRQQAEGIMDAGKAKSYHHAARWLRKARSAYLATDREAEWQEYLAELLDQHRRKYKLIPMLEGLL